MSALLLSLLNSKAAQPECDCIHLPPVTSLSPARAALPTVSVHLCDSCLPPAESELAAIGLHQPYHASAQGRQAQEPQLHSLDLCTVLRDTKRSRILRYYSCSMRSR